MTDDPFDDPALQEWAHHVREELVPKLAGSALTVSLVPEGDPDVKFAVELGLSILMDKPIIAIVQPGTHVPERLVRVADVILEGDLTDPRFSDRIQAAITKVLGS
ncbi:hypothetical protein GCM10009809_42090 [Isoptericola hypogeus]|uniref:Uncharacterized protein n=1 Tax=Isoptericola hypogeus TaxID=300179 RepID=A0ABN2JXS2_9MICO